MPLTVLECTRNRNPASSRLATAPDQRTAWSWYPTISSGRKAAHTLLSSSTKIIAGRCRSGPEGGNASCDSSFLALQASGTLIKRPSRRCTVTGIVLPSSGHVRGPSDHARRRMGKPATEFTFLLCPRRRRSFPGRPASGRTGLFGGEYTTKTTVERYGRDWFGSRSTHPGAINPRSRSECAHGAPPHSRSGE
jgi:hypothetical protein